MADEKNELFECFGEVGDILKEVYEQVLEDESNEDLQREVNQEKLDNFRKVYAIANYIAKENKRNKAKVKKAWGEPIKSSAHVSLQAKCVELDDMRIFNLALSLCDTFEVTPLTNGKLDFSFCFNDVARIVG